MRDDFVHQELVNSVENVAFDKNLYYQTNKKVFLEMIVDLLSEYEVKVIQKAIGEYIKNQIDEDVLFTVFLKTFGNFLVYKYFYIFTQTMKETQVFPRLKFQIERRVQMLSFKKQNILA